MDFTNSTTADFPVRRRLLFEGSEHCDVPGASRQMQRCVALSVLVGRVRSGVQQHSNDGAVTAVRRQVKGC